MAETAPQCSYGCEPRRPPSSAASPTFPRCVLATQLPTPGSPPPQRPQTGHDEMEHTQTPSSTDNCQCNGHRIDEMRANEFPSFGLYEELFFAHTTSAILGPLAAAAALTSSHPVKEDDVVKSGYLGKQRLNHRKYFVLRRANRTEPSRLEWYKTEKRFKETKRSASKDELFGPDRQRVIYLQCCLGVSKLAGSRHGYTVALYANDWSLSLVAKDQGEQDEWYAAINRLIDEERRNEERERMEERKDRENEGETLTEEDDGYWTYPPAAVFKEVWPVTVKPRGLGRTKSLAGESQLCLSATALLLVRVGQGGKSPAVRMSLLSVRRCGHLDGLFFVELGRSVPYGPGEIWMEAGDRGDPILAQSMHETVLETMRALRTPLDFSWSPIFDPNQQNNPRPQLGSKLSKPKFREKAGHVRQVTSPSSSPSKYTGRFMSLSNATLCHIEPHSPDKTDPESSFGSSSNFTLSPSLSPIRSIPNFSPSARSNPSLRSIPSTGSISDPRSIPSPTSIPCLPFQAPDPSINDGTSAAGPPGPGDPQASCCPGAEASQWAEESACQPRDRQGFGAETGSYMEMMDRKDGDRRTGVQNTVVTGDQHSVVMVTKEDCSIGANRAAGGRQGEGEGPDYMMMSPQDARSLAVPLDDYMNMMSPHTHTWPAAAPPSSSCSLWMLFNRSASRDDSTLYQFNHQPKGPNQSDCQFAKLNQPDCQTINLNQSDHLSSKAKRWDKFKVSRLSLDQHAAGQEQEVPHQVASSRIFPVQATSFPLKTNVDYSQATLVSMPGLGHSRPPQSRPVQTDLDQSNTVQSVSDQSVVRRCWLSSCLPSCLQAEDRN